MKGNQPEKSNTQVIFLAALLIFVVAGWIVYGLYGHRFITAMYEGRSLEFLNRVINGRAVHPLVHYLRFADRLFVYTNILLLLALSLLYLWSRRNRWQPLLNACLERHTEAIDALPAYQIWLWIALAAGLGLYLELMIIRLHSSWFKVFAYFKNISLLSCFLGLGIGYSRGARRPLATPLVMPLLALQIIFMWLLRFVGAGGVLQNPVSEQIGFGISQATTLLATGAALGFIAAVFAFNALCFIPLGHLASRLMLRKEKLVSYSWNLVGSLIGILLFSLLSFIWAPPLIWISIASLTIIVFLHKDIVSLIPSILASIIMLILLVMPVHSDRIEVYSPYQPLSLKLAKKSSPHLSINNLHFQTIIDLSPENIHRKKDLKDAAERYALPYYFKPRAERVLIVGSGTGNDVASAIRHGAGEIDAVEIDPAILQFGEALHPEAPYQADNVNVYIDDARAFIRHTDDRYDLIAYGMLDSQTLLSGRSGVRLDSFIYTVEAFREARSKLRDNGIICLSFCLFKPELGRKLFMMLQEAFDGKPPLAVYKPGSVKGYSFVAGNNVDKSLSGQLLEKTGFIDVTERFASDTILAHTSTDDWPFFYMPVRKYPVSYVVIIVLLLVISVAFVRKLMPGSIGGFSTPCFFLGAGFMLIETKGITELALVYGSTWVVVSVVIAAILIMAFLANLLIMKMPTPHPVITYGLLCASLCAGLTLSSATLSNFAPWLSRLIMTLVLTVPLFFSGLAFSSELKKSASVAVALSSNLLGAMIGGFVEYNSMYFGFRSLYFFALIMYALAYLGSIRAR